MKFVTKQPHHIIPRVFLNTKFNNGTVNGKSCWILKKSNAKFFFKLHNLFNFEVASMYGIPDSIHMEAFDTRVHNGTALEMYLYIKKYEKYLI